LVTLAGVGGVGKTRLAVEVATQLADEFVDGVWVFELAAVADPAAVPDAVAAVLGITQQPGKSVSESVASALEGRSRLCLPTVSTSLTASRIWSQRSSRRRPP
jgi:predicted ATPase